MNLFQSGSSNNNYSMPFGNQPANPFNRSNTNTNLNNSFGPSSSLSGPNSLFPPSGSNNLFSTSNSNMNTGNPGNMWGNSGNQTSNNLFRSNTGGQSMFPTGGNNSSLFQPNNSNSGFPRSNSMLNSGGPSFLNNSSNNSTPNFQSNLFNSSSSHNYGTRSNDLSSFYEKGSINYKFNPQKNNDGLFIYSITNSKGYNKKSLDEIRMEDYAFIKSGQVPDNIKKAIENNIQGLQGGGNSMGMGSGVMIGSSSNNLFNTGGGGMGGMNTNMGMNNNSMGSNNLFASNSNNSMNRNSMWPGAGNSSNNLFQSNSSMNNPFGQQGMGNNQGGNNLFSQGGGGSGPNFFNNNQSGNNFMNNNQQNSSNNLFSNQNRFQNQSSVFPQQNNMGMGMQSGNNPFPGSMSNSGNNLFQNRQNSVFPQNTGTTNNNLFGNRAAPPSLFPNQQNQMPNSLFPNQQGGQQMGFLSQTPGAPQLGSNPHLFPPQNNFPGALPGFPQQPYPQFPGYNPQGGFPTMDMSGNPHLFPPQGQNPYQQTQFQAYMAMQNMNDPYSSQYQNSSIFSPGPEDRRTYAPRQTLTDAIMNLDNKRKEEGKSSPRGGFTYFPYNPFEKKGRKMDVNDKENLKNISLLRPSQMTKRHDDEDAFTLIKKSKIVEDDVEIVMRPRLFLPTRGRNRSFSPMSTTRSRDNSAEYYARAGGKNIYNNSVKVSVNVSLGGHNENMEVRIFRQATIDELKAKVLERLRDKEFLRSESANSLENLAMKCELFYDSRVVHGSKTLDQANMVDGSNVYLQIDEEHVSEELFEENKRKRQQEVSQAGSSYIGMNGYERGSQISRYVPKLTKEGYYTVPAIDELARMPETELAMIEGFTVGNEWGKIEFEGRTDVRGLDLDDLVEIKHKAVEVYPEERYPTDASKPIRGEKLNKPAIVTLYKCFFTGKTKGPAFKKSLQERSHRDNNEFIDYDDENGVYKIRVKYF